MIHKVLSLGVVIAGGLAAACSSLHTKKDQHAGAGAPVGQSEDQLGSTARAQSSTEVLTQRKVMRTETLKRSVPSVRETRVKADINRMDVDDFVVMGLTRRAAESVVQQRQEHGKFKSVEELSQVPGVPQDWFRSVRPKLGAG